jgi:class 3 adenylate cyclase
MKRKIAAIMAADIAGYSKLVAEDEEETLRRLASYRSVFDDFIAKASGRVFNTAGDAVLAEFPSAVDAVRCAIDIQESLRTRNLAYPGSRQMNFRIGITLGDVVEREGDLLGDGVNIAARLQTLAEPGGICVSRTIYEQVTNKLSVHFSDIGEQQVKNIPTPIHAYMVASPTTASVAGTAAPQKAGQSKRTPMLALLAVVLLAGGGAVYWVKLRAPAVTAPTPKMAEKEADKPTPTVTAKATPSSQATPAPPIAATQPAPPPTAATRPAASAAATPSPAPPAPTAKQPATPPQRVAALPPAAKPRFDETRLRALADKQSIPVPHTIHIVEPAASIAKADADFLGAWGGDQRWGRRGRHIILLVTYIDGKGAASGIICLGPPTPQTSNQRPAHYFPFNGAINGHELKFERLHGRFKYQFKLRPDGIMEGRLELPNHRRPTITIERID